MTDSIASVPYPHPVPPGAVLIPEDLIKSVCNDRERFAEEDLRILADSIAVAGLQFPPIVRPMSVDGEALEYYALVAGDRRTRACRLNGYAAIPCRVTEESDEQASICMFVENACRADLNAIEEAQGYASRMARFGWSAEEAARCCGMPVRRVKARLRLLSLNEEIQAVVRTGDLALPYAAALAEAALDSPRQRIAMQTLNRESKPTVAWWKRVCGELGAQQAQESLLSGDDFLVTDTGPALVTVAAADPDDPASIAPTAADAGDPAAAIESLLGLWEEAAEGYERRGRPRKRAEVAKGAEALRQALAFLNVGQAPGTARIGGAA